MLPGVIHPPPPSCVDKKKDRYVHLSHPLHFEREYSEYIPQAPQGSTRTQKGQVCSDPMPTGVEEEDIPPQERIIVTALKSKVRVEGVYETIEWTVQNRARVESIGSSLSTLVLTDLLDRGVELVEPHLSQGFSNACFRACCTIHPGDQPPMATYGACPRLVSEKKWRPANTDESLTAAGFQGLLDAAAQQTHPGPHHDHRILPKDRSLPWPGTGCPDGSRTRRVPCGQPGVGGCAP
jgi:hypothetical protein